MVILRVQLELPATSGIGRDTVIWDSAWDTGSNTISVSVPDIRGAFEAFLTNIISGPAHSLGNYLGKSISRTVYPTMRTYDITGHLDGSAAGSPVDVRPLLALVPTETGGHDDLPTEVAACLSYHRAYGSDPEFGPGGVRPKNRDRGRIFIGPLSGLAMETLTASNPTLSSTFRATLAGATAPLLGTSDATWVQWSRADASVAPVVGGWIDDAPDIQRRRGQDPLSRTLWP